MNLSLQWHQSYQNNLPLLRREGFEDLLQECLLYWLSEKKRYDATKGASLKTFMAEVMRCHLQHITDRIHAQKRKFFYEAYSLDEYIDESEDSASATKKFDPSMFQDPALDIDLLGVLQKLTPEQKKICALLRDGNPSIHAVSKCLKKHHSYVYREVLRIRQVFESEGLRGYLERI